MNNNQNQYLSEEKYNKTKKVLITIGCISLCIGLTLLIISFIIKEPAMGQEGAFEAQSAKIYLRAGAFIFGLMIPMPVFFSAFGRNIMAYQAQQMMPIAQEGMKEMAPTVGQAAGEMMKEMTPAYKEMAKEMAPVYGEIAKEISKGVAEGINESNK